APIRSATTRCFRRHVVFRTFRLSRITNCVRAAIEWFRILQRDRLQRLDEIELILVRTTLIQAERLITHRHSLAALQGVTVVIDDFSPRAFVNDSLVALEARPLLAFERADGDAAEFDPAYRLPGEIRSLDDLDAVKPGIFERFDEQILPKRAADAAAPEVRIILQFL